MINKLEKHKENKHKTIITEEIVKTFPIGKRRCNALRGISIQIYKGDFTIIYGPSGSGKSTLLHCLIGLEKPTAGKIWIDEERFDNLKEDKKSQIRSKKFGVVYQQATWVKSLSIRENVALPLLIAGHSSQDAYKKADCAISDVGLKKYARQKPTEISGGEQQRICLARALVHNPKIIVLDEPTGNLDTDSANEMIELLLLLNKKNHRTIIMVTHNLAYLPYADQTIMIQDGSIHRTKNNIIAAGKLLKNNQ